MSNLALGRGGERLCGQGQARGTLGGVPHAYDFMAYAYLQLGQDMKGSRPDQDAMSIKESHRSTPGRATARARCRPLHARTPGWQGAAQLQPLQTPATRWPRRSRTSLGHGAARSGDSAAAQADIEELRRSARRWRRRARLTGPARSRSRSSAPRPGRPQARATIRRPQVLLAAGTLKTPARSTWPWRTGSTRCGATRRHG